MMYPQRKAARTVISIPQHALRRPSEGRPVRHGNLRIVLTFLLALAILPAQAGDAARGKALLERRESANCLLCHDIPGVRGDTGNVGPSLAGVGRRLSRAALIARISDPARFKSDALMPPYSRTGGLARVAPEYRGKPILSREEIGDVAEYLSTLK